MSHPVKRMAPPHRQRGIASILIVVLIGLVLIVTVFGVFRTVRGAQEQTLAVHARTPAEATAWYGAEAIRSYLEKADADTLQWWIDQSPSVGSPVELSLTGTGAVDTAGDTNIEAAIVGVELEDPAVDDFYLVTAHITGKSGDGRAEAAAPIEVIYRFQMITESGEETEDVNGPIFRGLKLRGNPTFPPNTDLNVLGEVEISNVTTTTNIRDINSTGAVAVRSGSVALEDVRANGDITLENNASARTITSGGNVTVSGDGSQGTITAEGDVTFIWSRAQLVKTQGSLVVGEPYPETCVEKPMKDNTYIATAYVEENVTWNSCHGGIEKLYANGDLVRYHGAAVRRNSANTADESYVDSQHLRVNGKANVRAAEATGYYTSRDEMTWGTKRIPANTPAEAELKWMCSKLKLTLTERNGTWAGATTDIIKGYAPTVVPFHADNAVNLSNTIPADKCGFTMVGADAELIVEADEPDEADVVEIPDVEEVVIDPPRVDANMLRTDANFEFAYVGGELQVTVRRVKDMSPGVYKLGWKLAGSILNPGDPGETWPDYLCPADKINTTSATRAGQKECTLADAKRLSHGRWGNSCFHVRPSAAAGEPDTYMVGSFPANAAPYNFNNCFTAARGIYFFPGNLDVGNSVFVATWIATGNIKTSAFHRTLAPNAAGWGKTCNNEDLADADDGNHPSVSTNSLANTISDSLCGDTGLKENDIGNAAMIAGHYLPDGSFSGGDITLGIPAADPNQPGNGTAMVDGIVIAGDKFTSRGSVTVRGNVIAAGQTLTPGAAGDFLSTFTLEDLTTDDFDPYKEPCMDEACKGALAQTLWSRYR